jgi:hypothetical protein
MSATDLERGATVVGALVVTVGGRELALGSDAGRALIEDIARYTEGLLDEDDLCSAWGISSDELKAIKDDARVFEAVRASKYQRQQDGRAARELARRAFVKAPRVLEQILEDSYAPTRTKIEAARELRAAAGFSADESAKTSEVFKVFINIGGGTEPITFSGVCDPPTQDAAQTIAPYGQALIADKSGAEEDE